MATPIISPVETSADYPNETTVVIIGGGIVGLVAALNLAERGVPVIVLKKVVSRLSNPHGISGGLERLCVQRKTCRLPNMGNSSGLKCRNARA